MGPYKKGILEGLHPKTGPERLSFNTRKNGPYSALSRFWDTSCCKLSRTPEKTTEQGFNAVAVVVRHLKPRSRTWKGFLKELAQLSTGNCYSGGRRRERTQQPLQFPNGAAILSDITIQHRDTLFSYIFKIRKI